MGNKVDYEKSSGNVFEDLGFENPMQEILKAKIAFKLNKLIDESGQTQSEIAERLGITQPDISKLKTGHYNRFTVERLLRFLTYLGQDVDIHIHQSKMPKGEVTLSA